MKRFLIAAAVGLMMPTLAMANDFEPQIRAYVDGNVKPWLADPAVVDAVKAQNEKTGGLSAGDIDALDKQWRSEAEAGSGPLVDDLMGRSLSKFLAEKKSASDGLVTEIFVMDAKGLNVGQSDITSDYMQGDEAKWQQTYGVGPDAVFVDEVEFDESTQSFQSQVSVTIADPASGEAIGAVTIGLSVEKL